MGRKKKTTINLDSIESLQELMQEAYHDACGLIRETQGTITNLVNAAEPMDTDDHTKLAKAKTDALKLKDSAIKVKLDIAKLQNEILKKKADSGDNSPGKLSAPGEVKLDDFSLIRDMMKKENKNGEV